MSSNNPFDQQLNQWQSESAGISGQLSAPPAAADSMAASSSNPSVNTQSVSQASNPFDQQLGQWSQEVEKEKAASDPGPFMVGLDSYTRTTQNMVDSILDLGARVSEKLGGGKEMADYRQTLQNSNATMNSAVDKESQLHPYAAAAGTGVGIAHQIIQGMATTGGAGLVDAGSTLLKKVGTGAGEGMVYGGLLNYSPTIQGRIENAVTGGLMGAAAPIAVQGFAGAGQNLKGLLGSGAAGDAVEQGAGQLSGAIGRTITPKSAARNDVNVITNAKQDVQKIMDDFVPGGVDAVKSAQGKLYKGLEDVHLDDATTQQLTSDPAIQKYLGNLQNNDLSVKKNLPDSNFAKLDQVQNNMMKDYYKNVITINKPDEEMVKSLDSESANSLMTARNKIVDTLNATGEQLGIDYPALRQMGEKKALYETISSVINKTADQKNMPPTFDSTNLVQNKGVGKLYDTLAGTPAKRDFFMNAIEKAGGNVENAQNTLTVLNSLRNNLVDKAVTNVGKGGVDLGKTGLVLGGDKILGTFVEKLTKGRYNNEVLRLMLSGPKMQEKLSDALSSGVIKTTIKKLVPLIHSVSDNAGKIAGAAAGGAQDNNTMKLTPAAPSQGYLSTAPGP